MTAEKNQRTNFRLNFDLMIAGLKAWPIATIVVLLILMAVALAQAIQEPHADATFLITSVAAMLFAGIGLKAILYLMLHPTVHKTPFPGSYLVATAIAMIPIFAFYGCAFYLLGAVDKKFPPFIAVLVLFSLGYPVFTIFVAGFLRANEWMQLNRPKF